MAKRHALELHHPVDRPAATLAAKAVPQVLCRRNHQAGFAILMKRTASGQVLAHALELDAGGLNEPLHRNLIF